MIKTAVGENLDYTTLKREFHEIISRDFEHLDRVEIDCFQEDNYLVILISENIPELLDRIKDILTGYQIIDNFIIRNINDKEIIYYDSIDNSSEDIKRSNYYNSQNFSVGFIISILGVLSLGIVGIFYYFTRPCVLGECTVIAETKTLILEDFKENTQDLNQENIKSLQVTLIEGINELKRIPSWSKSHKEATSAIVKYQEDVKQLDNLLQALQLENNSKSLTNNLPLSLDEWTRVKDFWQESIDLINTLTIESLQNFKQEKLNLYQSQLTIAQTNIDKEKQAEENLIQAQNLAQQIETQQKEITNLTDLENIEQSWQTAIKQIESIEPLTKAYQEKESILNNYLVNLIEIQKRIAYEKNAVNQKKQAEKTINLALDSQKNNQWTKAVSYWENALNEVKKIPTETFIASESKTLENNITKQLDKAKLELKQAIVRQEIKAELETICNQTELKCNYSIDNNSIKIFLNQEYLQKISTLSNLNSLTNNDAQKQQVNTHIEQVEKNYQYLSQKYKMLVEVYNPQRQLIMIYNTPF
ncbi:hypothetical protein ACN4EE_08365 [Geminocystis sp. CENA526]|uniref:hypothetical protein n=1 Tax=Geminocystis sp. CENA526 TaxID=1355871 RepID=UPI003D6E8229